MPIDFELISNSPPGDTLFEAADKLNVNFALIEIALQGVAPWQLTHGYILDDKATANGSLWRCLLAHTSTADDEPGEGVNYTTYWVLVSIMMIAATGAEINAGTDNIKFVTCLAIADSDLIHDDDPRLDDARTPTTHGNAQHSSTFITAADAIAPSQATATPTADKIPIADTNAHLDGWVTSAVVPDASDSVKGKVKLAGQLAGTADLPTVVGIKESGGQACEIGAIAATQMLIRNESNQIVGATVPAGSTVPTGTGFRHVTTGTEDAAAKLVENVDVHATAAIAESKLDLNYDTHSNASDPTLDQKSALGGTSGTPSLTNKYVTNEDSRNADARTPTSHGNAQHSSTFITASDAVAPSETTATPTASKIPIADTNAKLDGWVTPGKNEVKVLNFVIDNGTSVIADGQADLAYYRFPYAGTINSWSIISSQASSTIAIDIWKHATGTLPTVADKITSTTGPSLSNAQMTLDSTSMTGWTTSVAAGDIWIFHVNGAATAAKRVIVSLKITVTGVTI
jgi:hypothetical protein